ncbi:MAG TPA: hypothetical protein VF263_02685 [Longimicrobiaceae bacterium]
MKGLLRVGAVAAGVSLAAGCAPVLGMGGGRSLLNLEYTSCPLVGGSPAAMGMSRASTLASFIPRIQRMQARNNFGYNDVRVQDAKMRQIASGDC